MEACTHKHPSGLAAFATMHAQILSEAQIVATVSTASVAASEHIFSCLQLQSKSSNGQPNTVENGLQIGSSWSSCMVLLLHADLCCRRQNRSHGDDHTEEKNVQEEESASGSDKEAEESSEEEQQEGVAAAAPQQLDYMPPASKRSRTDASRQQQDAAWTLPSSNAPMPLLDRHMPEPAQPSAAALPANAAPLQKHAGPASAGRMLQQACDQTRRLQELQKVQSVGQQQQTHVPLQQQLTSLPQQGVTAPHQQQQQQQQLQSGAFQQQPTPGAKPVPFQQQHAQIAAPVAAGQTLGMQCLSSESCSSSSVLTQVVHLDRLPPLQAHMLHSQLKQDSVNQCRVYLLYASNHKQQEAMPQK